MSRWIVVKRGDRRFRYGIMVRFMGRKFGKSGWVRHRVVALDNGQDPNARYGGAWKRHGPFWTVCWNDPIRRTP